MNKTIYVIVKYMTYGDTSSLSRDVWAATPNKELAMKVCGVLNKRERSEVEFDTELYNLKYYDSYDVSRTCFYRVKKVELFGIDEDEDDEEASEEITNPDTLEAIEDCETGAETLQTYDTFDEFYNEMLKEDKGD